MSTSYQEIYDIFIHKITDFGLVELVPEEVERICFQYLQSSITKFTKCKQDLSKRDDDLKTFEISLTNREKEILATMMIGEWLTPQVYNIMNTKQFLSDQEYKHYSQANHLDKLMQLRSKIIEEGQGLMISYTYSLDALEGLK